MKIDSIRSQATTQEEYSDACRAMVLDFGKLCKRLNWQYVYKKDRFTTVKVEGETGPEIKWVHEKSGPKIGVVVAYLTPNGQLYMGASKCNIRADQFDRWIGVYKALRTAYPVIGLDLEDMFRLIPESLQKSFAGLFDRFHSLAEA